VTDGKVTVSRRGGGEDWDKIERNGQKKRAKVSKNRGGWKPFHGEGGGGLNTMMINSETKRGGC